MIFVDVGAHEGQTIDEVRRSRYPFDVIHAIEPMPVQAAILRQRYSFDPRIVVHEFALSHTSGSTTMYGVNDRLEASLYPDKDDVDASVKTYVRAVRASAFFRAICRGSVVSMNCEGGEVPILEDLLRSGQIERIGSLMIDFDARKVPAISDAPQSIVARLSLTGVNFRTTYPDLPTHAEQIESWLESI
jgi:FkbM family methyltransferase